MIKAFYLGYHSSVARKNRLLLVRMRNIMLLRRKMRCSKLTLKILYMISDYKPLISIK